METRIMKKHAFENRGKTNPIPNATLFANNRSSFCNPDQICKNKLLPAGEKHKMHQYRQKKRKKMEQQGNLAHLSNWTARQGIMGVFSPKAKVANTRTCCWERKRTLRGCIK